MKKGLFFVLLGVMVASCSTIKHPYRHYSNVVDFTQFTNSGFFITESNSVSFDYDPIGSVQYMVVSGYEVLGRESEVVGKMKDDVYSQLGGNGIINLKVEYFPATYGKAGEVVSPSSYVVSGMAIKYV